MLPETSLVLLAPAMFQPSKADSKYPTPNAPMNFASTPIAPAHTIIARGVRVEGEFRSQGNVTIEGELIGSLTCGGHLIIGPEATIQASIQAEEATISGGVQGNVQTTRKLELKSTARVKGDIVADMVAIEAGACLEGMVKIGGGGNKASEKRDIPAPPVPPSKKASDIVINTPIETAEGK